VKKTLVLAVTSVLLSFMGLNPIQSAENCTIKNQIGKQTAEFTNLAGEKFMVTLPPVGLTSEFSRMYLLNEDSPVSISTVYEGPNCIATTIGTIVNAKPQSVEFNDLNFDNWITVLNSTHVDQIKTYENKLYIRKKTDDLIRLLKNPEFSSIKINYQSKADVARLGMVNNGGDTWQRPTFSISKKLRDEIEADYIALNDLSKFTDYNYFKMIFLNLTINSTDGCFRYNSTSALTKQNINQYSSVNLGPPHVYYFSQPYSVGLKCKAKVSVLGSNFYVGEIDLIASQPQTIQSKTIYCTKGKISRTMVGQNPKCPNGYKLVKR